MLVPHINYTDRRCGGAIRTMEAQFPAYAALRSIGMPAVPELLRALKKLPAENRSGDENHRMTMMLSCLRDIYDPGGRGRELGRTRIEFEAAQAKSPQEKKLWSQCLNHLQLRPPK